jgi:cbb3-type cytochrome oxidase subunit 3
MNQKLKEALTLFAIQIVLYGILCVNFRAVAQAQYNTAAVSDFLVA